MSTICPVCQNPKSPRFRMCPECNEIYGDDQEEWPPWVVFLVADDNRWDWQEECIEEHEVTFSDLVPDLADALEFGLIKGEKIA